MVGQIESETLSRRDNDLLGRAPSLFMTLTSPVCKWGGLNRLIRRWIGAPETIAGGVSGSEGRRFFFDANTYQGIVEWYSTLKLQLIIMIDR